MKMMIGAVAGFMSGLIGSMGMGGGAVLMIYLSLFAQTEIIKGRGINLLFFIPIAVVSVVIYRRRGKIDLKTVCPMAAGGIIGAAAGLFLGDKIGTDMLSKAFGAGLLMLGIKETVSGIKVILARNKK